MWVRAFGRVAIASAICAALVAGCGKAENHPAGSAGTSSPSSTNAPAPVKADATYTESTLPIDFQSFATAVAPNGDLYLSTQEGLKALTSGASVPSVVVPDLPAGFGL